MPSPSCCCTSSVIAVFCTFSASYTRGTLSRGNSTSTTAPMICTILPWLPLITWLFIAVSSESRMLLCEGDGQSRSQGWDGSDRRGAADDLGNFLRDGGLARL